MLTKATLGIIMKMLPNDSVTEMFAEIGRRCGNELIKRDDDHSDEAKPISTAEWIDEYTDALMRAVRKIDLELDNIQEGES